MFAQRLRELRRLRGLSQQALANVLGVSQQAAVSYTHLDVYKRQL